MGRGLRMAAGLALALQSGACFERAPAVTGVRVVVTWTGLEPDQLSFELTVDEGTPLGDPERRPAQPGAALRSGDAVMIYLGPERAGQILRCHVEGLSAGRVIAQGSGLATVVGLRIVELPVSLYGVGPPLPEIRRDGSIPASTPDATMITTGADAGPQADAEAPVVPPEQDAAQPVDAMVSPRPDLMADAPAVPKPVDSAPDVARDSPPVLKMHGQPCGAASECASGYCTDGVCCMDACAGPCRSCAAPQAGTCTPTSVGGMDPRKQCGPAAPGSCGPDGTCNGQGACVYPAAGTTCATATCDVGTQRYRPASLCDGKGTCVPGTSVNCRPYRCETTACYISCTSSAQCCCGSHCEAGKCI